MARSPTTTDAFNAIAEPRRREILGALATSDGERDVTWLATTLGWPQPQVSKHLSVLREVGLVSVIRRGRHQMYSINGEQLQPIYDWVKAYSRFWDHKLDRIKRRAEQMQLEAKLKQTPRPTQGKDPHADRN